MPSIESICISQLSPISSDDLPFAVESESKLESHRSPSKFQNEFDLLKGCIYHLGGFSEKSNKKGFFTAYELLSDKCAKQENSKYLEFKDEVLPHFKNILEILLKSSPSNDVLFTSDYQFSENPIQRFVKTELNKFYELHKSKELLFNSSYKIVI